MRVLPSGTAGLLLECDDLDEVLGLYGVLEADPPEGVLDVVPAARTVLLVLDPAATTPDRVRSLVEHLEPGEGPAAGADDEEVVEVAVVYDGEDLDDVARRWGMTRAEAVATHTGTAFTVAFIGFAPGFAYCTGLPDDLAVPRLDSPRTRFSTKSLGWMVFPRSW